MRAILNAIRIALRAIRRNVLRASLTVLGILIGVAAVITSTALGAGVRDNVASQIQSIGSNFIIIWPERALASGARTANGTGPRLS
jgi:putative ABC transport system permease protein